MKYEKNSETSKTSELWSICISEKCVASTWTSMFDRQYLNIHSFGPQCNSQAATENHHIFPALIITITLRYHAQWLVWPAMGLHDPSIYQRVTLMKLKFSPLRYNQWKIEENMFTHCTFGYDACTDDEFKRHTFNENERFGGWICSGAERERWMRKYSFGWLLMCGNQ